MTARAESTWTTVGGVRMHARRWPSPSDATSTIVLVHGLGMSSRYFVPLAERLASDFYVVAPDLPGFGRSEKPPRVYSLAEHAHALRGWLEANGLDQPVLLGHSHGCQVVVELLARQPAIASAIVLIAPTVQAGRRTIIGELIRLVRDIPREPMALVPLVARDYLRAGLIRVFITLRGAIADRIEDKVGAIAIPTLLMRGERDTIVSRGWLEALAALMPRADVVEIARAGHAAQFSAADAVAGIVAQWSAAAGGEGVTIRATGR